MRFYSFSCPCGECDTPLIHCDLDPKGRVQHAHIMLFRTRVEAELEVSAIPTKEGDQVPSIKEFEIKAV